MCHSRAHIHSAGPAHSASLYTLHHSSSNPPPPPWLTFCQFLLCPVSLSSHPHTHNQALSLPHSPFSLSHLTSPFSVSQHCFQFLFLLSEHQDGSISSSLLLSSSPPLSSPPLLSSSLVQFSRSGPLFLLLSHSPLQITTCLFMELNITSFHCCLLTLTEGI